MCHYVPPPAIAPAWPWHAPLNWLAFAGSALIVVLAFVVGSAAVRRQASVRKKLLGWIWLSAACASPFTGFFLLTVVALPTNDALGRWYTTQNNSLYQQGCATAVLEGLWRHTSDAISQMQNLSGVLMFGGITLLAFFGMRFPLRDDTARAHTK